jgi:hypothetical protein
MNRRLTRIEIGRCGAATVSAVTLRPGCDAFEEAIEP